MVLIDIDSMMDGGSSSDELEKQLSSDGNNNNSPNNHRRRVAPSLRRSSHKGSNNNGDSLLKKKIKKNKRKSLSSQAAADYMLSMNHDHSSSNTTLPTITEVKSEMGESTVSSSELLQVWVGNKSGRDDLVSTSNDEEKVNEEAGIVVDSDDDDDDMSSDLEDSSDHSHHHSDEFGIEEEKKNEDFFHNVPPPLHHHSQYPISKDHHRPHHFGLSSSFLVPSSILPIVTPPQEPLIVFPVRYHPDPNTSSLAASSSSSSAGASSIPPPVVSRSTVTVPPAICFHNDMFSSSHLSHYHDADPMDESIGSVVHFRATTNDEVDVDAYIVDNHYDFHDYTTDNSNNHQHSYHKKNKSLDDIDLNFDDYLPPSLDQTNKAATPSGLFRTSNITNKPPNDEKRDYFEDPNCTKHNVILLRRQRRRRYAALLLIVVIIALAVIWSILYRGRDVFRSFFAPSQTSATAGEADVVSTSSIAIVPNVTSWYINAGGYNDYHRIDGKTWSSDAPYIVSSQVLMESRPYTACHTDQKDHGTTVSTDSMTSSNSTSSSKANEILWDYHLFCNERFFYYNETINATTLTTTTSQSLDDDEMNPNVVAYEIPIQLLIMNTTNTMADGTTSTTYQPKATYYEMKLYFNELYYSSSNERIFNIYIQNQLVYPNLDIYNITKERYAVVVLRTLIRFDPLDDDNTDNQILHIDFVPIKNNIKLNAIEIIMLSNQNPNHYDDNFPDADGSDFDVTSSNILSKYMYIIPPPKALFFHPIIDDTIDGFGYDNGVNQTTNGTSTIPTITEPIYINAGGWRTVPFVSSNASYGYDSQGNQSQYQWIQDGPYVVSSPIDGIGKLYSACPQPIANVTSFIDSDHNVACSERFFPSHGVYEIPLVAATADGSSSNGNNSTNIQVHYTLHFAELYHANAGERIFDVTIEDTVVAQHLDLYNMTKAKYTDYSIEGMIIVTDGSFTITLHAITSTAKINAIEIHPCVNM